MNHPGYQPFPPQPPQWGYPQPPPPPAGPSGVTGITAGVLAGLGALANIVGGIFMVIGLAALDDSGLGISGVWGVLIAVAILNVIAGLVLAPGAVFLLLRRMIGRWIVVAGCAVSIVSSLISAGLFATMSAYTYSSSGTNALSMVFPIITLVMVLLPSTTAWIRAKQAGVPPPYPPAPPQSYQQYPPQSYQPYPPQTYPPQSYPPQSYPGA